MSTEIETTVLFTEDVTVVELVLEATSHTYTVTGSSKKHPEDPFRVDIGEDLALARALRKLAGLLEDNAKAEQRSIQEVKKVRNAWVDNILASDWYQTLLKSYEAPYVRFDRYAS